jgi:hypothetical protein
MDISWLPKGLQRKLAGKGLGDVVKTVIDTSTGGRIKQCEGCKRRQQLLNNALKFENTAQNKRGKCLPCEEKRRLRELAEKKKREKDAGSGD